MTISAGKQYAVELKQPEGAGTVWVVHVYKKGFPFRKTISSDWFLDEEQARRFAEEVARSLSNGTNVDTLKARKPGWSLCRSNERY